MGAATARQCLEAGQLDELQIHLVPVLFGKGVRLFEHFDSGHVELERTSLIDAAGVTHLKFSAVK